jgi:hypothetical protein
MTISTYEGFVEHGQIRLRSPVTLPENATVYVVVPDAAAPRAAHIYSPRLANPAEALQVRKQVLELPPDVNL